MYMLVLMLKIITKSSHSTY